MSETRVEDAVNQAEYVQAREIAGMQVVQVWYGGTQVRVFNVNSQHADTWTETEVWSLSDPKGRAPEKDEIMRHMHMTFNNIEEEI